MSSSLARARSARAVAGVLTRCAPSGRGGYQISQALRSLQQPASWIGKFTNPWGVTLELDLNGYPDFSMASGLYELDTTRLIRKYLRPGSYFVDIGANLGYFTFLGSRIVGESGRVLALEPNPATLDRLFKNHKLNGSPDNVEIRALAAGAKEETVKFHHPNVENHGLAGRYLPPHLRGTTFDVQLRPLDDILVSRPSLIKMDIEGGEYEAFKGMKAILETPGDLKILFEYNPVAAETAGYSLQDVLAYFRELSTPWSLHEVGKNSGRSLSERGGNLAREINIVAIQRS